MADVKALAEELVNLSVKDVQELAQVLEEVYGIKPAAAAVVVAADGGNGAAAEAEQTEFDVILKSAGTAKPQSLKGNYMLGASICSTMSPGIKIDLKAFLNGAE